MEVLLTNDDGFDAPGLALLREVMTERNEKVHVTVAPDRHLSGCGHCVVTDRPLTLTQKEPDLFALDGMPGDCTRVGLTQVAPDAQWVLSGVNDGGNLGVDTILSGTVAAAREAALLGRSAVALSLYRRNREITDWSRLKPHLNRVLDLLFRNPPSPGRLWNVNFPDLSDLKDSTRIVRCPLEPGHLPVRFEAMEGGFRYRGVYSERPRRPGSDVDVCFSGQIALTYMRLL